MAAEDAKVGFEATASSVKDIFSTLNAAYDGKKDRKALIIASARGSNLAGRLPALGLVTGPLPFGHAGCSRRPACFGGEPGAVPVLGGVPAGERTFEDLPRQQS